jgi:DNA-binding transcriptional MocR family regulator
VLSALPLDLQTSGAAAGLSLVVHLPDEKTERDVLAAAAARGLTLRGLTSEEHYEEAPQPGLIVGYAAEYESAFHQALVALVEALAECGFLRPR